MRSTFRLRLVASAVVLAVCACEPAPDPEVVAALDDELRGVLEARGFTGRIESTLEERLGRPVDDDLAEVGRLLFFDPVLSLTGDNSCSGCHGPNVSFNGAQPIAIGVGNNGVVGPGRRGPHNQRRAPSLLNAAFFPRLMWDSRFASAALDPFDNRRGFDFPPPEGRSLSHLEHLLVAQAFTPVANRFEMAGGFDGDAQAMRTEVARRVSAIPEYGRMLAEAVPEIGEGAPIRYEHIARALAEFQFTLVRADAPIDRFARGDADAMTVEQKRGALLFFGFRSKCGECHIVRGFANEMFSDFEPHVLGVPQIVPTEGIQPFDGPGADEDYGLEQQTGLEEDRYKFRTQPLRNAAYQPSYMHDGAYPCLSDAIRHHLDARGKARGYRTAHLPPTLRRLGPTEPVLERLHDFIDEPDGLSPEELDLILVFVRDALADPEAAPEALRSLVPSALPSGLPVHDFEFGVRLGGAC